MTDIELEKIIKETLHTDTLPNRDSLANVLSKIETPVTKNNVMRYNIQTVTSDIIINKIVDIVSVWKAKRMILIPSLVVLFFVGAFSLSTHSLRYNSVILELAEQSVATEEQGIDYDDQVILSSFDEPDIDGLDTITNEI